MTSLLTENAASCSHRNHVSEARGRRRGRPPGVALDGRIVRLRRRSMALTQVELAEIIARSHRTVVAAEAGRRVSVSTAHAIARGLQLDLEDLLPIVQRDDV